MGAKFEVIGMIFQSTPSPRRATTHPSQLDGWRQISIHALPAEGDWDSIKNIFGAVGISIHALPAEGDGKGWGKFPPSKTFQSTPSPRRATFTS